MSERALVLGGGGVTGVAWEIGLACGLLGRGVDLRSADRVVGTSAGSVAGAQLLSGTSPSALYEAQLHGPGSEIRPGVFTTARMILHAVGNALAVRREGASDPVGRYGARSGAYARAARTVSWSERRRVIESRLPVKEWPERALLITAVDAETGAFVVFDRAAGVSLVDAVGASCAVPGVWPPVPVGGRLYIDGGMRSPANADLADGCARVLILAPLTRGPFAQLSVPEQAEALRSHAEVLTISPDRAARRAIGRNVLDPRRRHAAAIAGYEQADRVLGEVASFWNRQP